MRKTLPPLVFAALLASCTGDGSTLDPFGEPLGPPEVKLSPERIELSLIEQTETTREVTISNVGGLALRVESVTSGSPFLVPAFDAPVELRSGAAVVVTIRIAAGPALTSPQSSEVDVITNDPATPVARLPVHVFVTQGPRPEIQVTPDSLTVRVAPDGSDSRTLTIRNTGTSELHVSDISGSPFLTAGVTTVTVGAADSIDVVLTADAAGLVVGPHLGFVEITSDDDDEGQLSVPVLLSVESPFPATLDYIQANVFTPRCSAPSGCHGGAFPMVGLSLTNADSSYASMVDVPSVEVPSLKIVKPRDASNSYLVVKIVPDDPRRINSVMPVTGPALTPEVILVIRRWIDEGAQRR